MKKGYKFYCRGCGSQKIIKSHGRQKDPFLYSYSSLNGKPYFMVWLVCPNNKWFNFWNDCDDPGVIPYLYEEEYKKMLEELNVS